MHSLPELARLLENLLRYGVVDSVDHAAKRCRVRTGALLTAPLPWLVQRAGDARTAWAPSAGEQVLVLCPGGDPARGVVLAGIYSDAYPAPDGADTANVTIYPDGARIDYDPEAHQLTATLPEGGKATLTASGGVQVTGDTTITGTLHVTSDVTVDTKVTAAADVVGGGISLKNHKHGGVQTGGSLTGAPQ